MALLQIGGPRSLSGVEPFLRALFEDRDLLRLPFPLRPFQGILARRLARKRAPVASEMYRKIGGGSPIVETTLKLARRVEEALRGMGRPLPVHAVMRYTPPRADEVARKLKSGKHRTIALLPLYPHWTRGTTWSAIRDFERSLGGRAVCISPPHLDFGTRREYVQLLSERIQRCIDGTPEKHRGGIHLLFSAHSLPVRYLPGEMDYPGRVRKSARAVVKHLHGFASWHLSYQSASSGPMEWLGPTTEKTIAEIAAAGASALVVVPFSFVSDHLETLYEIDIVYARQTRKAGIGHFARVPAFNDDDDFASFMARLAVDTLDPKNVAESIAMEKFAKAMMGFEMGGE